MRRIPAHLPSVLCLGAVCQIGQVVLLRELMMVFHGNELSFGVILGAWMVWVGIGSRIAGRIGDDVEERSLLRIISASVLVVLPASIVAIRLLRGLFPVQPGAYLSVADIVGSAFAVTAPVGLLLGVQFVVLARIWRRADQAVDTAGAGKTYIGEALGHTVGGMLFSLALVHLLNSFQIAVAAGIAMGLAALPATWSSRVPTTRPRRWGHRLLPALLALAFVLIPFLESVDQWAYEQQWSHFYPRHELLSVYQSRHGTVSVAGREDQRSFFQSGNLLFSAAGRPGNPSPSPSPYEEHEAVAAAHLAMVQHPSPKRVLLIGGGLRGMLREIVRHPVEHVDYVELDPVVTEAARTHLSDETVAPLDRDDVRLIHGDGRFFVKRASEEYDLIIVDGPDPTTAALNRYYTKEFFQEARGILAPEGVLAIGATSTPDLRSSPVRNRNATIYHTLRTVFPDVLPAGERHLHFFAATEPGLTSYDPSILRARYEARGIQAPGFSPGQYQLLLEQDQLRRVNWSIRTHGRSPDAHLRLPEAPPLTPEPLSELIRREAEFPPVNERYFINSDLRPIGYVHSLAFWNLLTRAEHAGIFRGILTVEPWWIVPLVALAVAVPSLLRVAGRRAQQPPEASDPARRFAVLFAVFTTGLSTMTLQVSLLFSFQNVYGFVYEMIGLITAGFMAGLALGTAGTHRLVRKKSDVRTLRTVQLAIAVFAVLIALLLPQVAGLESPYLIFVLFFALTILAGALNGVDFPLATSCCLAFHRRAERATGIVYGLELIGSCIGAIVAGVIIAPVLGIVASCLLAAIGNATAFVVLLIPGRTYATATA